MNEYKSNDFWNKINNDTINNKSLNDNFDDFRNNQINYKLAMFNPTKNGIRYLKTLLYTLVHNLSDDEFKKITSIKNRNPGSPICTIYNNEEIDLDYIQAIDEVSFIQKNITLKNGSILEIGAGYG